jgi:DNA-binding NarL/FixJ family response regulator
MYCCIFYNNYTKVPFFAIIMEPAKIILWGDNAVQTAYLQSLMGGYPSLDLIGVFDHSRQAVENVRALQPSIGILQISRPGFAGYELTRQWIEICPAIRVLWITENRSDEQLISALRAGARGYLLANQSPHSLLEAINSFTCGGAPIAPEIAGHLIDYILERDGSADYQLSDRERSILKNLVDGIPIKLIAPLVFLSEDGVKKNLHNIYAKLGVNNGKEAVAKAIRERIV